MFINVLINIPCSNGSTTGSVKPRNGLDLAEEEGGRLLTRSHGSWSGGLARALHGVRLVRLHMPITKRRDVDYRGELERLR